MDMEALSTGEGTEDSDAVGVQECGSSLMPAMGLGIAYDGPCGALGIIYVVPQNL